MAADLRSFDRRETDEVRLIPLGKEPQTATAGDFPRGARFRRRLGGLRAAGSRVQAVVKYPLAEFLGQLSQAKLGGFLDWYCGIRQFFLGHRYKMVYKQRKPVYTVFKYLIMRARL